MSNSKNKFDTPEKRQAIFKAFCEHVAKGYSVRSFTLCAPQTVYNMIQKYSNEFSEEDMAIAKAKNFKFWEDAGIAGMMGKVRGFNAAVWIVNARNRMGFKGSDTGYIEDPFTTIDKLLAETNNMVDEDKTIIRRYYERHQKELGYDQRRADADEEKTVEGFVVKDGAD